MTDQTRVNWLLQALFTGSTTVTFTPGTGGGSALAITPPYHLRLMTVQGSNSSNGTEATSGNCAGYTQYGASMGASAFGTPSAGQQSNNNPVIVECDGDVDGDPVD